MRVSRKFWGGMIAGGIVGAVFSAVAMPRMRGSWSLMGSWRPEVTEMIGKQWHRVGKMAGKLRR